jgi:beta-glucanase (GH16 family)
MNAIAILLLWAMSAALPGAQSAAAPLFFEDFDGAALDTTVWRLPTGGGTFYGRTQVKPPEYFGTDLRPVVSGGTVTLQLDTYNASGPGSFWGHEIQTLQKFTPGANGLQITSRMRFLGAPPGGLVGGFFTWGFDSNSIRDELDVEMLTNDLGNERLYTNVYDGKRLDQLGIGANVDVPGLDMTEWTTYEMRWFTDRVQWFVDGSLIREQTGVTLDRPSEIRFNLWAPDSGFSAAYNAALQPAGFAGANAEYEMEIDYLRVSVVPVPPAVALFGSALGLLGFVRAKARSRQAS